jgi:hypothetical protein
MPQRLTVIMRIVIIVALTMIGFAHQPVSAELPASVQYAAYTLPDGTLPVFCVTVTDDEDFGGGDGGKSRSHYHGCEACRLAGTVLAAEPPVIVGSAMEFPRGRCPHCRDIPRPELADISTAQPRAPPLAG